jgi:hypothetical protein
VVEGRTQNVSVYSRQCFDLPPDLVEAIGQYCVANKITKRAFIEVAARRMIVAGMKDGAK